MSGNIAIITDKIPQIYGIAAQRLLMRMERAASEGGGHLICPTGGLPPVISGVQVIEIDVPVGANADHRETLFSERLGAVLDRLKPRLAHCMGLRCAMPVLLRRVSRVVIEPGITPAQRLRSLKPDLPAARLADLVALEDNALTRADAIIARSNLEAVTLSKRSGQSSVFVVPDRVPENEALTPTPDLPLILHLGTGQAWEGADLIFAALQRIDRPWHLHYLSTGTTPMPGPIPRKLAYRVTILAIDEDPRLHVQAAQVVVAPLAAVRAVQAGGAVPTAALWALGGRRPLITAELPAIRAVAGAAGIYHAPEDIGSLAMQLEAVLSDGGLRASLVEHAAARCKAINGVDTEAILADVWAGPVASEPRHD